MLACDRLPPATNGPLFSRPMPVRWTGKGATDGSHISQVLIQSIRLLVPPDCGKLRTMFPTSSAWPALPDVSHLWKCYTMREKKADQLFASGRREEKSSDRSRRVSREQQQQQAGPLTPLPDSSACAVSCATPFARHTSPHALVVTVALVLHQPVPSATSSICPAPHPGSGAVCSSIGANRRTGPIHAITGITSCHPALLFLCSASFSHLVNN